MWKYSPIADIPECSPDEIICNATTFRNYPGVEDQAITGKEMGKHIEKGHVAAFSTFKQLTGFVEGKPPQGSSKASLHIHQS